MTVSHATPLRFGYMRALLCVFWLGAFSHTAGWDNAVGRSVLRGVSGQRMGFVLVIVFCVLLVAEVAFSRTLQRQIKESILDCSLRLIILWSSFALSQIAAIAVVQVRLVVLGVGAVSWLDWKFTPELARIGVRVLEHGRTQRLQPREGVLPADKVERKGDSFLIVLGLFCIPGALLGPVCLVALLVLAVKEFRAGSDEWGKYLYVFGSMLICTATWCWLAVKAVKKLMKD